MRGATTQLYYSRCCLPPHLSLHGSRGNTLSSYLRVYVQKHLMHRATTQVSDGLVEQGSTKKTPKSLTPSCNATGHPVSEVFHVPY